MENCFVAFSYANICRTAGPGLYFKILQSQDSLTKDQFMNRGINMFIASFPYPEEN